MMSAPVNRVLNLSPSKHVPNLEIDTNLAEISTELPQPKQNNPNLTRRGSVKKLLKLTEEEIEKIRQQREIHERYERARATPRTPKLNLHQENVSRVAFLFRNVYQKTI